MNAGHIRPTHGMSRSPEYDAWGSMIQRCTNPKISSWARYGGRGIRVHGDWIHSFEQFFAHVGPRPDERDDSGRSIWSLDRIDNDGNYEPGNVRWARRSEQQQNRGSMPKRPEKILRFCLRGHDIEVVGRIQGRCKQCDRDRSREAARKRRAKP